MTDVNSASIVMVSGGRCRPDRWAVDVWHSGAPSPGVDPLAVEWEDGQARHLCRYSAGPDTSVWVFRPDSTIVAVTVPDDDNHTGLAPFQLYPTFVPWHVLVITGGRVYLTSGFGRIFEAAR